MKKNTKQPVRKDTETLIDTLGLGFSQTGFGLSSTPRPLVSVMEPEPAPADRLDIRK